ncbi:Protein kinase-like domain [Pseudocohnilembus persalinus]|uniref:Protein kinase-like domain n=1 Tax=Pseudocohnilembus persalinus TaxID=266149 RepID=A0A0V0QYN9_PSEPJ|nr:Protein kinase-like domain [Pseudocohnilembus persalinus]|eukprot:KRX07431.1 Protein kinase-like domain [Pseudocohnilembus persalinus]
MGSKINEQQTTHNEQQNSSNNISNKNRRIKITYTYNQNENLGKTLINSNNSNINQIQQQKNQESENLLKLPKNINNLNNINNTNNSSNINSIRSKASSINSSVKNSPFKKSTQLEPVIYKNNYEKQVQRKDSQFLRAAIKEKKMQNSNQQNEENITNKKSYVAKFRNLFDEFEQNKNLNLKLLKIQSDNNAQQKEMDKSQNKQEQNQNQNLDQNKNQNNSQSYVSQEKNEQSSTEKNQKQNKIQNKQLIKTVTKQLSISENEDMFPECSQISYILEDAENASQDLIRKQRGGTPFVIQGNIMKWKIGDFIGAGTFGQVFRAMDINSGEIFAVKKIPLIGNCNQEFYEATEQELSLINNVNHKNVVKYYGHEKIEKNLCIYLEYMDAGNIQNIYQKFGALEEENIRLYTRQILQGLAYLHNKNIIHRDIKGANILVDNEGTVKLSDFGCAKQLEITLNSLSAKEDLNNTLKGSVPWMAPEVVKQTNYSFQADIWSFGCTILEMATGKLPWMQYNFEDPISAIMKIGISDEIPLIPENLGDSIKNFLKLCLNRDPEKRPSANQLLEHQFIQI